VQLQTDRQTDREKDRKTNVEQNTTSLADVTIATLQRFNNDQQTAVDSLS